MGKPVLKKKKYVVDVCLLTKKCLEKKKGKIPLCTFPDNCNQKIRISVYDLNKMGLKELRRRKHYVFRLG